MKMAYTCVGSVVVVVEVQLMAVGSGTEGGVDIVWVMIYTSGCGI